MTIRVKYKSDSSVRLETIDVGDWIDLHVQSEIRMRRGEFKLLPLGVAMELPPGYEAHVVPRSSTFKNYSIIQTNSVGIIDSSYCGDNDWWFFPAYAFHDTKIPKGARICQFRIVPIQPSIEFEEVKELGNKDRGGHGSTGV